MWIPDGAKILKAWCPDCDKAIKNEKVRFPIRLFKGEILMTKIEIDLTELKKELRGIAYKTVHEELEKFDIIGFVKKYVAKLVSKQVDKHTKTHVYKYLEESQIIVPDTDTWRREKKIALNTFIIQIVREVIGQRVNKIITDKIKITIDE